MSMERVSFDEEESERDCPVCGEEVNWTVESLSEDGGREIGRAKMSDVCIYDDAIHGHGEPIEISDPPGDKLGSIYGNYIWWSDDYSGAVFKGE